jgi:hypothetical protein
MAKDPSKETPEGAEQPPSANDGPAARDESPTEGGKPDAAAAKGAVYLPTLPDGWSYALRVQGDGKEVSGEVVIGGDGRFVARFDTPDGRREQPHPSFGDAAKSLAEGIKALDKVQRDEAKLIEARETALARLGPAGR